MELCKHVETKFVPSGAILFRPGQIDDSIYVVRNGLLKVYIIERVSTHASICTYIKHVHCTCMYLSDVYTLQYVYTLRVIVVSWFPPLEVHTALARYISHAL